MKNRLTSQDPADIKWRVEQMDANSRIEGIERDPDHKRFMEELEAQGLPVAEQIRLFVERVKVQSAIIAAAE